jgi:hypothetical protein
MAYGPAELIVVKFPGNEFRGEILPALADLVESGTIRLIDFLAVRKDAHGEVTFLEAAEAYTDGPIDSIVGDEVDLINHEDVAQIAEMLEANSTAALLLFEHRWAATFTQAIRDANGELILDERIPARVVEEVAAANA